MGRGLRTQLTATIALIVLLTVALISLLANLFINKAFESYAKEQKAIHSQAIASNLSRQYDRVEGRWDLEYVHGVGMYALYEGYIIRLYDEEGAVVWDAENHDMSLCGHIMGEIERRMEEKRPYLKGSFSSQEYSLLQEGQPVGKVVIRSYGPYFFNENDFQLLDKLNGILLLVGGLALLLSVIAGMMLAKRMAWPLTQMARISGQIAHGDYSSRFKGSTRTRELDELAGAINHMAGSLERQEHLRKRLTTDVAHELRTPLSAVASHLEMMMEGLWEPTQDRLTGCYEEIGRISGLVADLENLAKVENHQETGEKTPVDLLELAQKAGGSFQSESEKKHIQLVVEGQPVVVPADRDRMQQVLVNLLSNAVKYTSEYGHIQVTVTDGPERGSITVSDDGIGISSQELPLIFERFYRTDKSRNRKTGGTGIGLTIAKSIVEAHGGRIEARSQVGRGSSFTVILPKEDGRPQPGNAGIVLK